MGLINAEDLPILIDSIGTGQRSDREVTIVAMAYIEEHMRKALQTALPGLDAELENKLFGIRGPLLALAARVDLARALGLINSEDRKDLKELAKVRNEFAHNVGVDSFSHEKVVKPLNSLKVFDRVLAGEITIPGVADAGPAFVDRWKKNLRGRFVFSALVLAVSLHNSILLWEQRNRQASE